MHGGVVKMCVIGTYRDIFRHNMVVKEQAENQKLK